MEIRFNNETLSFAAGFCLVFNFRAKILLRPGVMDVKRVARVKSMSSSLVAVSGSTEIFETDVRRKICCPTIKTFENFVCFHHSNCVIKSKLCSCEFLTFYVSAILSRFVNYFQLIKA